MKSTKALVALVLLAGMAVAAAQKLVPDEFVVKPGAIRYWTFDATAGTRVWVVSELRAGAVTTFKPSLRNGLSARTG